MCNGGEEHIEKKGICDKSSTFKSNYNIESIFCMASNYYYYYS